MKWKTVIKQNKNVRDAETAFDCRLQGQSVRQKVKSPKFLQNKSAFVFKGEFSNGQRGSKVTRCLGHTYHWGPVESINLRSSESTLMNLERNV